jgi:hypothetical protein
VDRQPGQAHVLACDTERLLFDLAPDLCEVDKAFFEVEELASPSGVDHLEDKRGRVKIPWPRGRKSRPAMLANA